MRYITSILCSFLLMSTVCNTVEAQTLMQTAKKAEQQAKEKKQQELSRYNEIVDSKDLSKYNQFIADYPRGSKTPEIRKRVQEIQLWNDAQTHNTIASYKRYLNATQFHWYEKEANRAIQSLKQIAEKNDWDKVVAINTVSAYQKYIDDNPDSGYRSEAEKAIATIQSSIAWEKIKDSDNISELWNFAAMYPNAAQLPLANERIHELKGLGYYKEGDLDLAYSEFSQVYRSHISSGNRNVYDEVMEYHEFSKFDPSSSEEVLIGFLKSYPNSKYYDRVSNLVAVAKAKNFSVKSSDHDYNQALSYARDSYTRNTVDSYISFNKKKQKEYGTAGRFREGRHDRSSNYYNDPIFDQPQDSYARNSTSSIDRYHKEYRKAAKSIERNQNGGYVNFGLNFLDLGVTGFSGENLLMYYDVGLMFRFGNFKDRIQFTIGLRPGIFCIFEESYPDYSDGYCDFYNTDITSSFHTSSFGQLKLNLINTSENSRFFMYGEVQYNLIRDDRFESEYAWRAGCGFAWKHFDWLFYYRQDIDSIKNFNNTNNHYFGMSMICYWQL